MGCRRVRGDSDESSGGPEAFEVCDSRVVEASHGTLGNRLTAEARERSDSIHWANHVWLHLARTLLLMNRNLSTVAVNVTLPMVAMTALAWAFPNFQMEHIFLESGLMLLLLVLAQSVAAQHLFGGEERAMMWREAAVSSLSQTLFSFIGRDIASLAELALTAVSFSLVYWPISHTYVSCSDTFAIGFGVLYAVWGMNHIWAISCPSHTAMLVAVIVSFMCFLF